MRPDPVDAVWGRPLLCLVTDRRRMGMADDFARARRALAALARDAAEAGVDLVQVRERDVEAAALIDLVADIRGAVRGSATRVVVNDRIDVALAAGADGVHLRADSIPPRRAREMAAAGFLIGRSVRSAAEAREHAPWADFLVAGTVFPTPSKPAADRWLQAGGLRDIVSAASVPVLAIGGVTLDRVGDVAATGAAGVAAIGLFLHSGGVLSRVVRAVRERFDSVGAAS